MGIKITGLKSLDKFDDRVQKMRTNNLANRVAVAIAEEGVRIAEDRYRSTGVNDVSIYYENNGDGNTKIIAEGEGLNYIEFGTGIMGKGTYPDDSKLPNELIEFESRGEKQSTQGWEYNYYKEQNKSKYPNLPDWTGFQANAQMFYTSEDIRNSIPQIVRVELKGDKK